MTHNTEPDTEVRQLRALLAMSRELMQADEPSAVLVLTGRALAGVAHIDRALLLVRGEVDETVSFDSMGRLRQAPCSHDWYRMALERLDSGTGGATTTDPRTMLVGVPTRHAMAALAAGWTDDATSDTCDGRHRLLGTILELSVAALDRLSSRSSLENLVSTQYKQMADTADAHANELARRDEADDATRAMALTDVLTGVNNQRGFYVQAEHMFRLARRRHAACTVLHADIDGLRLVNEQLGHEAGDRLIQDIAAVFRASTRESDVLAHFGGNVFVAFVLDDAHPRVILARLLDNLHTFNLMQDRAYRLSVSAGAVRCDTGSATSLVDYVQLADREIYLHERSCLH